MFIVAFFLVAASLDVHMLCPQPDHEDALKNAKSQRPTWTSRPSTWTSSPSSPCHGSPDAEAL